MSLAQDRSPGQDGKSAPPISFGPYPFLLLVVREWSISDPPNREPGVGVDGKNAIIGSERDAASNSSA